VSESLNRAPRTEVVAGGFRADCTNLDGRRNAVGRRRPGHSGNVRRAL